MKTPRKVRFCIFNEATGDIRCTGVAAPDCVDRMVRAGEVAIKGRQGDPMTHRVVMSSGSPSIRKRSAAVIEALQAPRTPPIPSIPDILEALRAKGIELSASDLDAARVRRQLAATPPPA